MLTAIIFTGGMTLLLVLVLTLSGMISRQKKLKNAIIIEEPRKEILPPESNDTVNIPCINNKMEETKELSLNEKLDKLLKNKTEEEKEPEVTTKKWKLPWRFRLSKAKAKKNWAIVEVLKDNGEIEFSKKQINDGTIDVDGFPRIATIDHKLTYKSKPFFIIPTWSIKPFSPVENYEQTVKEKMNIAGRRAVLATLETEKIKPKKDFGSFGWIILIIAVAGGAYYLAKSQGWI